MRGSSPRMTAEAENGRKRFDGNMRRVGDFSKETILTLSKRAALLCSNPDCGVLTSGPDSEGTGAINIGEAAHIYACAAGAARYNPLLGLGEVSDITNGLWLCCNCHKQIDDDEKRFQAELLFEWRRQHEQEILKRVGSKNDIIRDKIKNDQLRPFENTTYLAQQIVLDKPKFWEYKLTLEILRTELEVVQSRWRDLKHGLYVRKSINIPFDGLTNWLTAKFEDSINIAGAFKELISVEMNQAWGPPGKPGDEKEILRVCRLIVSAANNFLEWEEDLRFSRTPEEFREIQNFLQGTAGAQLDEMMRIPIELAKIFELENPTGTYKVDLVFTLPENFSEDFNTIINRCMARYVANHA